MGSRQKPVGIVEVPMGFVNGFLFGFRCEGRRAVCIMGEKQVWVKPETKEAFTASVESGVTTFVFAENDPRRPEWTNLGSVECALISQDNRLQTPDGRQGPIVNIQSSEDQDEAMKFAGTEDLVAMVASDWRIIPAENLIAHYQETRTKLIVFVRSVEDAEVMLTTLEVGVDGVIIEASDAVEAKGFQKLVSRAGNSTVEMTEFVVQSVRPIGMGDRSCVDTCSLLGTNEGMLVGSSSQGMILVLSEAAHSEYVPSRPFRVNAGPVASYCLLPDGKTKYLSEVTVGTTVLSVSTAGTARTVPVARSKIEQRPLLLVEYVDPNEVDENRQFAVILQNAETVRLAAPSPVEAIPITRLRIGDRILGVRDDYARHTGLRIKETILER